MLCECCGPETARATPTTAFSVAPMNMPSLKRRPSPRSTRQSMDINPRKNPIITPTRQSADSRRPPNAKLPEPSTSTSSSESSARRLRFSAPPRAAKAFLCRSNARSAAICSRRNRLISASLATLDGMFPPLSAESAAAMDAASLSSPSSSTSRSTCVVVAAVAFLGASCGSATACTVAPSLIPSALNNASSGPTSFPDAIIRSLFASTVAPLFLSSSTHACLSMRAFAFVCARLTLNGATCMVVGAFCCCVCAVETAVAEA
mmetsp:Transcript_4987/g.11106  ORF Transcript_4987/g.11106 Transcript_4987/m.11106 type:complete len:262 (+) Transcript_4987:96-881(+)